MGSINLAQALETLCDAVIAGVGLVLLSLVAVWMSDGIVGHASRKVFRRSENKKDDEN